MIKFFDKNDTKAQHDETEFLKGKLEKTKMEEYFVSEHPIFEKLFIEQLHLNKHYKFIILHDYLIINDSFNDN